MRWERYGLRVSRPSILRVRHAAERRAFRPERSASDVFGGFKRIPVLLQSVGSGGGAKSR